MDRLYLGEKSKYVISPRVSVGQHIKYNWTIGEHQDRRAQTAFNDTAQFSQSKNRVLTSMKNFPNKDKFWQYSWRNDELVRISKDEYVSAHLLVGTIDLPNGVSPSLIDFSSRRMCSIARPLEIWSQKKKGPNEHMGTSFSSLGGNTYGMHLPCCTVFHIFETSITNVEIHFI